MFDEPIIQSSDSDTAVWPESTVPEISRVMRSRPVLMAPNWLAKPGETVHAALFEDESVDMVIDTITAQSGGLFTVGHIASDPALPVFFGSYKDHVSGKILTPSGRTI